MDECKFAKLGKCGGDMTQEGYCEHHRRHFLRVRWSFVDELRAENERLKAFIADRIHDATREEMLMEVRGE